MRRGKTIPASYRESSWVHDPGPHGPGQSKTNERRRSNVSKALCVSRFLIGPQLCLALLASSATAARGAAISCSSADQITCVGSTCVEIVLDSMGSLGFMCCPDCSCGSELTANRSAIGFDDASRLASQPLGLHHGETPLHLAGAVEKLVFGERGQVQTIAGGMHEPGHRASRDHCPAIRRTWLGESC